MPCPRIWRARVLAGRSGVRAAAAGQRGVRVDDGRRTAATIGGAARRSRRGRQGRSHSRLRSRRLLARRCRCWTGRWRRFTSRRDFPRSRGCGWPRPGSGPAAGSGRRPARWRCDGRRRSFNLQGWEVGDWRSAPLDDDGHRGVRGWLWDVGWRGTVRVRHGAAAPGGSRHEQQADGGAQTGLPAPPHALHRHASLLPGRRGGSAPSRLAEVFRRHAVQDHPSSARSAPERARSAVPS